MKHSGDWIQKLRLQLGKNEVLDSDEALEAHSGDKWFARARPDAVVLPRTAESVAATLRFAFEHKIPVTPRGAGYGYVGGCVPVKRGIALSLARMNRIKEINALDFVAVVEPGVITQKLQEAVEKKGMFYPPDPASRGDCHIGGNIATNAGGPRCLKYGVTRDYVLGLQIALADGTLVKTGSRTHKNKTGFDVGRIFVGSEGLLGVVTEATLKLLPKPPYRCALAVGFSSMRKATRAIRAIFAEGFLPCAVELADEFTLAAAYKRTGAKALLGCKAHLILEVDGQPNSVRGELRALKTIVNQFEPRFIQQASGDTQCEKLWRIRREFSYALRDTGLTKLNEDVVVPRSRLEDLFKFAAQLQKKFDVPVACFGHAGDGNIHVNVMVDTERPEARERSERALDELFKQVLAWDGVVTGEHGVGLAKKPWWEQATSEELRQLHRTIKKALDPRGILNPGKFV